MTIEEAKTFLDNLKVCIEEHPIVADWLVEIADRKTENSSEKPNNSKMEQVEDEPQIFTWGKEVHEFCKMKCNKSKARLFDGDRFIVCGQSNDSICINLPACPLGKWITGKGYHILPMDEPQTERSEDERSR